MCELWPVLHRWFPLAFPRGKKMVRPLSRCVIHQLMAEFEWPFDYTAGVFMAWQRRWPYARAVLKHTHRIDLYGQETGEVSEFARQLAKAHIKMKKAFQRYLDAVAEAEAAAASVDPADPETVKRAKDAANHVNQLAQVSDNRLAQKNVLLATIHPPPLENRIGPPLPDDWNRTAA